MKALAWAFALGVLGLAIVSRFIAIGRKNPPTMAEERRAALSGLPQRYRVTQPGHPRRQWRPLQRQKKRSAQIALVK